MTPEWQRSTPGEMRASLTVQPHLWILALNDASDPTETAEQLQLLSNDERVRYHRYLRDRDRELFLAAHAFARRTLSHYAAIAPADWAFATNEFGRPEITNPDSPPGLRFNLAHTSGMVAMVVHDTVDGGVDVEHFGNVADPVAISKTVFADTERRDYLALPEQDQDDRFYTLWTLKESFIKAKGKGLALPLKDFAFAGFDQSEVRVECGHEIEAEPASWHFTVRKPSPGFVVATAYRCGSTVPGPDIKVFETR